MNKPSLSCAPTGTPDEAWDRCVRTSSWTIGLGTIVGVIGTVFLGTETPILIGTGLGITWSLKRCRGLFREQQKKRAEVECIYLQESAPVLTECFPMKPEMKPEEKCEPIVERPPTPPPPSPTPQLPPEQDIKPPPVEEGCNFIPEPKICEPASPPPPLPPPPPPPEKRECIPVEIPKPETPPPPPPPPVEPKIDKTPECPLPPPPVPIPPEKNEAIPDDRCTCKPATNQPPIVCSCPPPITEGICTCPRNEFNNNTMPAPQKCSNTANRFTWPPLLTFTQVKQGTCTCPVPPPEDDTVCTCSEDP